MSTIIPKYWDFSSFLCYNVNGSENMKINEQLLNKKAYYVIGVSGGCDSMFLLIIILDMIVMWIMNL